MPALPRDVVRIISVSVMAGFAMGAMRLLYNFLVLALGFNEAVAGTLQTMESLAAIAMAVPAAWLTRRVRGPHLLAAAHAVSVAALLVLALPLTMATLATSRIAMGVGQASAQVVVAAMLMRRTTDEDRQWVFSMNVGFMLTAQFVGNSVSGALPTLVAAWGGSIDATSAEAYRGALLLVGAAALVGLVPALRVRDIPRSPEEDGEATPAQLVRRHWRPLLRYLSPNLALGLGAGLVMPFMNIYFRSVYRLSDGVIGVIFASGSISMAAAQFVGPGLARRRGKIGAVVLSQSWSIPFLVILMAGAWLVPAGIVPVAWFIGPAVVAFNARIGLMNLGNPVYQTYVMERVPEPVRALSVSLLSIAFQLGWFVMPQLSGQLQVRFAPFGFVPVFLGMIGFYLVAIAIERRFEPTGALQSAD